MKYETHSTMCVGEWIGKPVCVCMCALECDMKTQFLLLEGISVTGVNTFQLL
jgi:hypothetical protein